MSNAIEGILGVSMEKIREMVDVNTIIGDPISALLKLRRSKS